MNTKLRQFVNFTGAGLLSFALLSFTQKRMSSTMFRLGLIAGDGDKKNEIVFHSAREKPESYVLFFGGDVQDYKERMLAHRDNGRYEAWCLESTAQILHDKYPTSDIFIIKPAAMHYGTFSVYSNFVDFDFTGVPLSSIQQNSWPHLLKLFRKSVVAASQTPVANSSKLHEANSSNLPGADSSKLQGADSSNLPEANSCKVPEANSAQTNCDGATNDTVDSDVELKLKLPKHIIGFSKGCVVLNQLLFELESALKDPESYEFIQSVSNMTWLDGGHSGHGNGVPTWVYDPSVLAHLLQTPISINAHVTPYQVKDQMRPWIGKEHKKFVATLRKLNVPTNNFMHFENEHPSIENHFEVLRVHHNV